MLSHHSLSQRADPVKRLSILPVVLLSIVVAACSDAGASGSPSQAAATPEPTAPPSVAAESPGASFAEPSLHEGAGDLADVLPAEIGGLTITYQSASGDDFPSGEPVSPEEQAFLDRLGADASDITTASGSGIDMEAGVFISITAIRVEGADEDQLRDEFRSTMEEGDEPLGEEATVAGKSVLSFGAASAQEGAGYFYVKDDVVYIVAGSPDLAEEAISKLP